MVHVTPTVQDLERKLREARQEMNQWRAIAARLADAADIDDSILRERMRRRLRPHMITERLDDLGVE